jgi:hypothetical protein
VPDIQPATVENRDDRVVGREGARLIAVLDAAEPGTSQGPRLTRTNAVDVMRDERPHDKDRAAVRAYHHGMQRPVDRLPGASGLGRAGPDEG